MTHPYWPIFDLVIRTPRIELRLPNEAQLLDLATVAANGIHDPSWQPLGGWTDLPSPQMERGVLQWNWGRLADWKPESWGYNPVVIVDGRVVGTQGIGAQEFAKRRVVGTGSWLGREFQGQGIGREMRAAIVRVHARLCCPYGCGTSASVVLLAAKRATQTGILASAGRARRVSARRGARVALPRRAAR